ncbi:hypothetical protein, partial [Klebsiella pneumoniae]|uniref:hypothetical protein n=1 Tax=Klebsiella pneumoniae TaxID=573 RepID=UPI0039C4632F
KEIGPVRDYLSEAVESFGPGVRVSAQIVGVAVGYDRHLRIGWVVYPDLAVNRTVQGGRDSDMDRREFS